MLAALLAAELAYAQTAPAQLPTPQTPANPGTTPVPSAAPLVLIDPAHGGSDSGAVLAPTLLEKDVTLAFARRLRQELTARGIAAALVRDGDSTFTTDQRAALANARRFALYLCFHGSSQGSGLRIYTAMLPVAEDSSGPFTNWDAAQSASLSRSRWVQEQLVAALQKMGFPNRSLIAPLRPLNNITIPAVAIEVGPTTGEVSQLASDGYQAMICAALANAIVPLVPQLRSKVGLP